MGTMDWLERVKQGKAFLKELGYERERAAVALLSLSFFGILYFLVSLNAPPGWAPVFAGLMICYLTAFLALASQWFWARWFASGLGWSGFMLGLMSLVMIGWHPSLAIYTVLHGIIVGALMGQKMSSRYELQSAWRERYGMDEYGVARLGKAVTRGAASLPTLIMWALAPREGDQPSRPGAAALLGPAGPRRRGGRLAGGGGHRLEHQPQRGRGGPAHRRPLGAAGLTGHRCGLGEPGPAPLRPAPAPLPARLSQRRHFR
jgi:hypothetical protein